MIDGPAHPTQRQAELDTKVGVRVSEAYFLNDSEKYGSTLVQVVVSANKPLTTLEY